MLVAALAQLRGCIRQLDIGLIGGAHGRSQVVATLKVADNPSLDWVFSCHFRGDPVMPGSLGLEALWQLTGFYLGWLGAPGRGRALAVREVKLTGMVTPRTAGIEYVVDIKRVLLRRLKLAIADGVVKADVGSSARQRI